MGNREELLRHLPNEGFLKITATRPAAPEKLADEERVALIRKGNELFNLKKFDLARKIFMTTGYSDGLIRLGDLYLKQSQPLEAFRMYLLAPDRKKVEAMLDKSVAVLRHWLAEGAPQGSGAPAAAPATQGSAPASIAPAAAPAAPGPAAPAKESAAPPKPSKPTAKS